MKKSPMVTSIKLKKEAEGVCVSTYRFTTTICILGPFLFHQDRERKREVKFYTQVGLIAAAFSTITLKATEGGGGR